MGRLAAGMLTDLDKLPRLSDDQFHELQRFAELGRISASMLHEISNPLSAALLYLEELADQPLPAVKQVRDNMYLLRKYVEAVRQQIRLESNPISFAIGPQIDQLKRVVRPIARRSAVQLKIDPVPPCRLYGDPVKFQQIMANLIINATEAYKDDVSVGLAKPVQVKFQATVNQLTVKVIDWGAGISLSQLEQLFKPFYTTKAAGHGLGIGLAIVERYATQDFRGTIRVTSSRRHGTQFTIKFPLSLLNR